MKPKNIIYSSLSLLAAFVFIGAPVFSAKAGPSPSQQAQVAELKKTYPLTTCPVSGDELDSKAMGGKPVDYLYAQKNADGTETSRLVRFCCKDCLVKFKRNPSKFLKVIDKAQAKKASAPAANAPGAN